MALRALSRSAISPADIIATLGPYFLLGQLTRLCWSSLEARGTAAGPDAAGFPGNRGYQNRPDTYLASNVQTRRRQKANSCVFFKRFTTPSEATVAVTSYCSPKNPRVSRNMKRAL